jgi:hypothetical protein
MRTKDHEKNDDVVLPGAAGQAREVRLRQKFEDSLRNYKRVFWPAKIVLGVSLLLSAVISLLLIGGGFLTAGGILLGIGIGVLVIPVTAITIMNAQDKALRTGKIVVHNACQLIEQVHINQNPDGYISLMDQHLQAKEMLHGRMKKWAYKRIASLIDEDMPKIKMKSSLNENRHIARVAILEEVAKSDQDFFKRNPDVNPLSRHDVIGRLAQERFASEYGPVAKMRDFYNVIGWPTHLIHER